LALALNCLLDNEPARRMLAANAAHDARTRFDLAQQAESHLRWYRDIRAEWR
jgi:glycosyltransferase involved in cell wall biosynthesis